MASWVAISMTGRRGASLPAADPSRIFLLPSYSAPFHKHGPSRFWQSNEGLVTTTHAVESNGNLPEWVEAPGDGRLENRLAC
jgi:hypothetical protein